MTVPRRDRPIFVMLLVLLSYATLGCSSRDPSRGGAPLRPNILFVVIDTLRADHLHSYGYASRTSDTIDALAKRGWLFELHLASSSQTVPSTLSLMLSQHPAEHGFRYEEVGYFARNRPFYPSSFFFLSEVLSDAGFATAAYVANPWLTQANGFAQGFDDFVYSNQRGGALTAAARDWLTYEWDREHPFFVYLHYFDVHWEYDPLPAYRAKFEAPSGGRVLYSTGAPYTTMTPEDLAATMAAYDGEIAYVDDQIGALLETLDQLAVTDHTVIVVTSDHGDEFLDHRGLGHGTTVYGELIRVPLVFVYPSKFEPGKRIRHLTSHIDVAPTLLELVGVHVPASFRGHSLTQSTPAFAEVGPWFAVHDGQRKLIVNDDTETVQLFAAEDELDQRPLPESEQGRAGELLERLSWYRGLSPVEHEANPVEWDEQQINQLRSLGYVE